VSLDIPAPRTAVDGMSYPLELHIDIDHIIDNFHYPNTNIADHILDQYFKQQLLKGKSCELFSRVLTNLISARLLPKQGMNMEFEDWCS
jgi:hypothetical protein